MQQYDTIYASEPRAINDIQLCTVIPHGGFHPIGLQVADEW